MPLSASSVLAGVTVLALSGAAAPGSASPVVPAAAAPGGEVVCALSDARVDESSGLTVAGGLWWTHDDSRAGDVVEVHGLDGQCRTALVVELAVPALDAEDLASASGPGGSRVLWLADVGDNGGQRSSVTLYRFPLPSLPTDASGRDREAPRLRSAAEAFPLAYAEGPRDAEALLVAPDGGVVVVSKPLVGAPGVFVPTGPLVAGETGVLARAGQVRLGQAPARAEPGGPAGPLSPYLVTGGAVADDGRRVALRTYTDVHEWWPRGDERGPGGGLDLAAVLGREPDTVVPLPVSEQGEAVAYTADGTALLLTSEGVGAPVHRLDLPAVEAEGGEAATGAPEGGGRALPGEGPLSGPVGAAPRGASPAPAADGVARPAALAAAAVAVCAAAGLLLWAVRLNGRRERNAQVARALDR